MGNEAPDNTALIISIISLCLSAVSISWPVYERIFLRPRGKVYCRISKLITTNCSLGLFIDISITNLGPGDIFIESICVRKGGWFKRLIGKQLNAVIINDQANTLNVKLPYTLPQYQRISQLLEYQNDCFLKEQFSQIGFCDSVGKYHWASKKDARNVNSRYKKDFK